MFRGSRPSVRLPPRRPTARAQSQAVMRRLGREGEGIRVQASSQPRQRSQSTSWDGPCATPNTLPNSGWPQEQGQELEQGWQYLARPIGQDEVAAALSDLEHLGTQQGSRWEGPGASIARHPCQERHLLRRRAPCRHLQAFWLGSSECGRGPAKGWWLTAPGVRHRRPPSPGAEHTSAILSAEEAAAGSVVLNTSTGCAGNPLPPACGGGAGSGGDASMQDTAGARKRLTMFMMQMVSAVL